MQRQVLLELSIKSINDTLSAQAIVHSSLVLIDFRSLRKFLGPIISRASLAKRGEATKISKTSYGEALSAGALDESIEA